ncbi:2,4-dienoyl-CoA reductase (NADPH) [Rhizobium sp. CF080]|uniref:oxidoreductase n=1 Tax=Rhizobium sp. (strain CF080) TaxID=1144310 RepID=UPI00027188BB|nr:FAD-dependent oxidoreductase [Rhizobium sp. CF080]EUB99293.1 2,4-dienoyl-CoA reductase (NADPH) [Rhizobium sp. CF080]
MSKPFPHLFQPLQIGNVRLKNRIAMAPMGFGALSDDNGVPTQRYVDYFAERAKGGAGLLLTGMLKVEDQIEHLRARRGPVTREFIKPFADLTEQIHALGTKIFVQLSAGLGYQGRPHNVVGTPVAPSPIPSFVDDKVICRELSTDDIASLVTAFGNAAEILAKAGVDGIEVHGHAGFLIDQFSCSLWNKRTDRYGGDLRGRMTFAFEIFDEIKRRLGPGYPVQYRYGLRHYMKAVRQSALPGEDYIELGRDIDEGLELSRILEEHGFDSLAIDAGTATGHYWAHPPIYQQHGCMLDLSAMVKETVSIPVIAVGRLDIPELANSAIADGKADVISLAKALLADPYWPTKVQRGKVEDIRPCIGCHQACSEQFSGRYLNSCTVNPACGRERTHTILPALQPQKVLIAGGGVAGMETARVAALRGHSVVLYEKSTELGGHLIEAGIPEDKKDVERLNDWYKRQIKLLGVDIHTGTEVTTGLVEQENPDVVIVATGSVDLLPRIPGSDRSHVVATTALFKGDVSVRGRVIVVGGGENGCEIALWLRRRGHEVAVVERQSRLVNIPVANANRNMLLDMLVDEGVEIHTDTTVQEIGCQHVRVIRASGEVLELACNSVVMSVGMRSERGLYEAISDSFGGPVYGVGDCADPTNIMKAVWDGFEVARTI